MQERNGGVSMGRKEEGTGGSEVKRGTTRGKMEEWNRTNRTRGGSSL